MVERLKFTNQVPAAKALEQVREQLAPHVQAEVRNAEIASRAWKAVKTGDMRHLGPDEQNYINFIREVRASARPITAETIDSMSTRARTLEHAFNSYQGVVDLLNGAAPGGERPPGLPTNANIAQRSALVGRINALTGTLKLVGADLPELRQIPINTLVELKTSLKEEVAGIRDVVQEKALEPASVKTAPEAAAQLTRLLQNEAFSPARIEAVMAKLSPEGRASFEKNLSAAALLVDQAINAELKVPGHGRDFVPNARPRTNEQREDEVAHVESRLANHVAHERIET